MGGGGGGWGRLSKLPIILIRHINEGVLILKERKFGSFVICEYNHQIQKKNKK